MGYITAFAKTDFSSRLNYTDRNIVEKLFQTFTMRIEQFDETWNSSQPSGALADCLRLLLQSSSESKLSIPNHRSKLPG